MEHDVRMDGATVTISHLIDFNSVLAQNRSVNGVPVEFSLFWINICPIFSIFSNLIYFSCKLQTRNAFRGPKQHQNRNRFDINSNKCLKCAILRIRLWFDCMKMHQTAPEQTCWIMFQFFQLFCCTSICCMPIFMTLCWSYSIQCYFWETKFLLSFHCISFHFIDVQMGKKRNCT